MRASNSAARSPANTRWVWESTKPGITARPPTSVRDVRRRASTARPRPGDPAAVDDDRGVGDDPEVAVEPLGRCVTSSPMLVDQRAHLSPPQSRVPTRGRPGASADIAEPDARRPARPSRRRRRRSHLAPRRHQDRLARVDPGGARAVSGRARRGRRARPPRSDRRRPAEGGVPGRWRTRPASPGRRRRAARAEPLVRLEAARLERARRRSRAGPCRADSGQPAAQQLGARADAVGEVALGRRADADARAGRRRAARRRRREVHGVHRRGAGAERSGVGSSRVGVTPKAASARLVLGRLLGEVDVQRRAGRRAPRRRRRSSSAGTARTEWTAAPTSTGRRRPGRAQLRRRVAPSLGVPSPKRSCSGASGRCAVRAEAAVQVAGVEQRQLDPGVGGRQRRASAIAFGSPVGLPSGRWCT